MDWTTHSRFMAPGANVWSGLTTLIQSGGESAEILRTTVIDYGTSVRTNTGTLQTWSPTSGRQSMRCCGKEA
jgi:hypothetical protein